MTPLRQRLIAAMQMRGFSPRTHESYLDAVRDLAKFTRRSPDTLAHADLTRYFGHLVVRESMREGHKIVKRTLANLSAMSLSQAEAIRAVLKGQPLAAVDEVFEIIQSRAHGAVHGRALAMGRLRLSALLGREPCRERNLVLAMIAARVLGPQSKLATTRCWDHSTLGELFGVSDADENELYAALDWLRERQPVIEQ